MTKILSGTYNVGIDLTAALDTPVTVSASGRLNAGLVLDNGGPMQAYVDGTIAGDRKGIYLTHGGLVNLNGSIYTYYNGGQGVVIAGARGTVASDGRIVAPNGGGIGLSAGGFIDNGGFIYAFNGISASGGQTTVINRGRILSTTTAGGGVGVALNAGGTVDNRLGASPVYNGRITGLKGVLGQGSAVTVTNGNAISGSMTSSLGRGVYLRAGGSVTNDSTGTIVGYEGVYGRSHVTIVNAGKIEGNETAANGFGVILFNGGGVTNQSGGTIAGQIIAFVANTGTLAIDPLLFQGQIDGFRAGDSLTLTGVADASGATIVNGNTLEIQRTGHAAIDLILDPGHDVSGNTFAIDAAGHVTTSQVPCFLRDTAIRSARGEVPVQDLIAGDCVATLSGPTRPIVWIGKGTVRVEPGKRTAATPVVVRKGALGRGVPYSDQRVTKGHALFLEDVLIPAEFLVNYRTIAWDDDKKTVEFYHIELDKHDVLFANGAAAESYRDDGNRALFQNANSAWDSIPKPACAPVLTGGPIVDTIWRTLLDRDTARPKVALTGDPDPHLLVDGVRIDVATRHGAEHAFRLTGKPETIRIVSRAAAPAETGLGRDARRLGVAIGGVMLLKGAHLRMLDAEDPTLSNGFHGFESEPGPRWTDGDAVVPPAFFDGAGDGTTLVLVLGGATQYPA